MAEIKFKRDTSFRKRFFVPDSFAHPAKMDAQLLIWIVEQYTAPGEVILDPMAGSGTTMLACTLGRNVVLVELEEKFCQMMRDNWEVVRMHPQLGYTMGECQILQGDARSLDSLQVDKCIFSPPYTNRMDGGMKDAPGMLYTDEPKDAWFTTRDQNNIGNLPYGSIDKVITSPPWQEVGTDIGLAANKTTQVVRKAAKYFSGYTSNIDSIITSPPYENQIHRNSDEGKEAELMAINPQHYCKYSQPVAAASYIPSSNNIGNLKGQTYLDAMLAVYQNCHAVLKPSGLMILVTKNFIRNKKVVRLDQDTIKLCEMAGFTKIEIHQRELPAQSFWRVIYKQKYPDVEEIKFEDVLVFKKDA